MKKNESENNKPCQRFCTYIKHKRNDKSGISQLKQNGKLETESQRQVDILNDQFKSVVSNSCPVTEREFDQNGYMNCSNAYPDAEEIHTTANRVLTLIEKLNVHKAGGPDDTCIRPAVLKELAHESLKSRYVQETYQQTGERHASHQPIKKDKNIYHQIIHRFH